MSEDDLLKESPQLAPWRPAVVMSSQLRRLADHLGGPAGAARFITEVPGSVTRMRISGTCFHTCRSSRDTTSAAGRGRADRHWIRALVASTVLWTDDDWVVDSTRSSAAGPGRSRGISTLA
jgi:hypothetical protein